MQNDVTTQRYLYKELSTSYDVVSTEVTVNMDKTKDLNNFERDIIVGARKDCDSVPETLIF